jgi:predicted aldo/keto reductase-like oxidoreductase
MKSHSSRRNFLAAGLALPLAVASATTGSPSPEPAPLQAPSSSGKVTYRLLGKTGFKVSAVGCGCGSTQDQSVIRMAAELGINYFDTHRAYLGGQSERMIRAGLGGRRKEVYLSSKTDGHDKAGALKELEISLKEFGTDYLDVWQLHGVDTPEALSDELVDAMHTAKQQGKARAIGVGTHQLPKLADRVIEARLDVVSTAYNFTMDPKWIQANSGRPGTFWSGVYSEDMIEATETLSKAGVGLVALKVMAGGMRGRNPTPQMRRPNASAAAIKWVLRNPLIATVIPGMADMDQVAANFKVMGEPFTPADERVLAARLEEIRFRYCRMCGHCDGQCPKGLPVRNVLRYLMYADDYGQFAMGREHFLALPPEHQAVRCNQCPTCAIECPNGVRVAERLVRAQELFA